MRRFSAVSVRKISKRIKNNTCCNQQNAFTRDMLSA